MGSSREREHYGILLPVGGGDPIPLLKTELVIGRRPKCDIRLDFENVSGRHAVLAMHNGLWSVRDLGSTNGTSVNGTRLTSTHTIMPEDELRFADHLYTIDYEPSGPEALMSDHNQFLDDDVFSERKRHSLMELAGLGKGMDFDPPTRGDRSEVGSRAEKPPATVDEDFGDALPKDYKPAETFKPVKSDEAIDDFLKLIDEEVNQENKDG